MHVTLFDMAIDKMDDRHGKELREYYQQRGEKLADLQKTNPTEDQMTQFNAEQDKKYSQLVSNHYTEAKGRMDQEQESRDARKFKDEAMAWNKQVSDEMERGEHDIKKEAETNANEAPDSKQEQMDRDAEMYQKGANDADVITRQSKSRADDLIKEMKENHMDNAYVAGFQEGRDAAVKDMFKEKFKQNDNEITKDRGRGR